MHVARGRCLTAALIVVAVVTAGCSSGGDGAKSTTTTAPAAPPCKARTGERPAKAVLRCTEASVAFIENELGTGTGLVVVLDKKRYLLTNEHVVDPFDAADATIGENSWNDLPVVGIDASADIALLGPLEGNDLPEPLTITDGTKLERGDEVFLVGYPGEANADDLGTTIASGIVSRLRSVKEFNQSYIQTNASIGGGQSGGPLFDENANLVGISGLSFAEEFALVLAGRDVATAARRIVDGKGDTYVALPADASADAGDLSGTLTVSDASDGQVLFLPAAGEERTWHLSVDMGARPLVSVQNHIDGEPLAISSNAEELQREATDEVAAARGGEPPELPDFGSLGINPDVLKRETSPGEFTIPVKADESALVIVGALFIDAPVDIAWRSDQPLVRASRTIEEQTLSIDDQIDRVINPFDTAVDVLVDLDAGQEVELNARSPQGDVGLTVFEPDLKLDHLTMFDPEGAGAEFFDDTDDGLYGLDAKTTYKPAASGIYRIRLYINDLNTIQLRFSIADCAKAKCGEPAEPETSPSENGAGG